MSRSATVLVLQSRLQNIGQVRNKAISTARLPLIARISKFSEGFRLRTLAAYRERLELTREGIAKESGKTFVAAYGYALSVRALTKNSCSHRGHSAVLASGRKGAADEPGRRAFGQRHAPPDQVLASFRFLGLAIQQTDGCISMTSGE
jgi:hypothetical protein